MAQKSPPNAKPARVQVQPQFDTLSELPGQPRPSPGLFLPPPGAGAQAETRSTVSTATPPKLTGLFSRKPPIVDENAMKIKEVEALVRINSLALELLKKSIDHNSKMDSLRGDTDCPGGHSLEPVGTTMDDDWTCDGAHAFGSCKSFISDAGDSKGMNRFRCDFCDFDLCEKCYKSRSNTGLLSQLVQTLQGRVDELWSGGGAKQSEAGGMKQSEVEEELTRLSARISEEMKAEVLASADVADAKIQALQADLRRHTEAIKSSADGFGKKVQALEEAIKASADGSEKQVQALEEAIKSSAESSERKIQALEEGLTRMDLEAVAAAKAVQERFTLMDREAAAAAWATQERFSRMDREVVAASEAAKEIFTRRDLEAAAAAGAVQERFTRVDREAKAAAEAAKEIFSRMDREAAASAEAAQERFTRMDREGAAAANAAQERFTRIDNEAAAAAEAAQERCTRMDLEAVAAADAVLECFARVDREAGAAHLEAAAAAEAAKERFTSVDREAASSAEKVQQVSATLGSLLVDLCMAFEPCLGGFGGGSPMSKARLDGLDPGSLVMRLRGILMPLGEWLQGTDVLVQAVDAKVIRLQSDDRLQTRVQAIDTRLEKLAKEVQTCRDQLLHTVGQRVDRLEGQRDRDLTEMCTRMERRLSDLNTDTRERRINERVDVLSNQVSSGIQKLEQRFQEFKKPCAKALELARPMSARAPAPTEHSYRVEWDVAAKHFSGFTGPRSVDSPSFNLGSAAGLHLRFHPAWEAGVCLLAVVAPDDLGLACRLYVDGVCKPGKPLPLSGGDSLTVFYAAEFPAHCCHHYQNLAVDFQWHLAPRHGRLSLT